MRLVKCACEQRTLRNRGFGAHDVLCGFANGKAGICAFKKGHKLLRFVTQKGIVVIPRSTKPEHIKENFDLLDFTLTAEEIAQLSALDKKEPLIGKPETPELVEFSLTW